MGSWAGTTDALADLQGASLAASRSGNSGTTYRAVLHFAGAGEVPVTPYSTSGPGPSRTVAAVNGWLGPGVTGLSGDQAVAVAAALEKLGLRVT